MEYNPKIQPIFWNIIRKVTCFADKSVSRKANKSRVNLLSICFCLALALLSYPSRVMRNSVAVRNLLFLSFWGFKNVHFFRNSHKNLKKYTISFNLLLKNLHISNIFSIFVANSADKYEVILRIWLTNTNYRFDFYH